MLIDGELVEASGGATFDNINPATEEVLGARRRRHAPTTWTRAIAAARRAFDETDWSTEPRVAQALPAPAAGRARGEQRGAPRPSSSPRSAAPVLITYGPQLDAPLDDGRCGRPR